MQRECKFCDNNQIVNMEKPQGSEKWVVTNLDGSIHRHNTQSPMQYRPPQQQTPQQSSMAADRIADIKQAHEENMEASSKLTSAVNRLCDTLVDIEKLLSVYVHYQEQGGSVE